ncbi:P60-like protein [Suhomyces tanzawaensis NRRL Y-17324]|uniref:Ribosome biogenesis protein NOP53 n=1 Tax=Suhomyces tanzawaensis NRRL Y-17324 TaxID=984487 RepID=A0A1E4SAU2_9ASCO|nr:P60-like protein [Suhomyces tanzawaensis NRRL Y-17324]ODV76640.1 P60-like protein [Suhomyces tanzawaensis NRRL Y-17324]
MSDVKEQTKPKRPQPSRKGKKAWRKNVDIQDVEEGLEEIRDREILLGKSKGSEDDNGFVIDSAPTEAKRLAKKSKTSEILANKSKIDALKNPRANKGTNNNTIQGVKKTDLLRLIKLNGGKYKSESKALNRAEQDGLVRGSSMDVWGDEPAPEFPENVKPASSISEVTKATVVPKTMKESPILLEKNDLNTKSVDAGKSYNPSLESWKALINKEYSVEYKLELNRQKMQEHKERIQHLIETLEDEELLDSSDEEEEEQEEDKEEEGEEKDYKLSLMKPVQVKIKTKARRNREAKHKKRVELEDKIKGFKKQLQDLQNLDTILKKEQAEAPKKPKETKAERKRKKLFKYDSVEAPLEVKLSDELTNNLKNLKPEGNLFYDQMLNLQSSGKIEARVPVAKKRKYAPKMTEKWSYKDFK